jgi:hypothetical protein
MTIAKNQRGVLALGGVLCSNRAATRVNILKTWERHQIENMHICRVFANSRNLQQTVVLNSHGRGRWFEPSIAHS